MTLLKKILLSIPACLALLQPAMAQSTDGFHSIQIFPLVVDSTTFAQRFYFVNANEQDMVVHARFYPGNGTTQALVGPINCNAISVPALGKTTIVSLKALCPALVSGSAHGFLYTWEDAPTSMPYAGYSQVRNFRGIGFSVEAFPAHTFTSADSVVTGLRRLSSTSTSPAYQSNCFIANLNQVTGTGPTAIVQYSLYRANEGNSFATGSVTLAPGRLVRLLDVFEAAGAPAGEYNDADIRFTELGTSDPGIMAYCTVQDNTSFGADFRIAKQEFGNWGVGSQDGHVVRTEARETQDSFGRRFDINSGSNNSNTHVTFFRHPDYVRCELLDPVTHAVLPASYGIEMRLRDRLGAVVAGGNNITSFGEVYLGDKEERDFGANTMYFIDVEGTGANSSVVRPYELNCESGSGHPAFYNLVKYHELADRF